MLQLEDVTTEVNKQTKKNDWYPGRKWPRDVVLKTLYIGADMIRENKIESDYWEKSKSRDVWGFIDNFEGGDWQPVKEILRNMQKKFAKDEKKKNIRKFEIFLNEARVFYRKSIMAKNNSI